MEGTEPQPVWKQELLAHRILPGNQNIEDDNKSRCYSKPNIETSVRAADIIKFFNRVADGDVKPLSTTMARRPAMAHHLAAKPGNTGPESGGRNATLASSSYTAAGGEFPAAGGADRASPTRHGRVSHPSSPSTQGVSRARTLNAGSLGVGTPAESGRSYQSGTTKTTPRLDETTTAVTPQLARPHHLSLVEARQEEEEEQHRVTVVEFWESSSESEHEWETASGAAVAVDRYPYHPYAAAPAAATELMGEEKRLFLSNGGVGRGDSVDNVRAGARLRSGRQAVNGGGSSSANISVETNKRNLGRGTGGGILITAAGIGGGDSDGMMGSGGESDSSEEIHYGPGFVSRLKSRYMSVALRGSARGSLGSLRRTASLEDFLEIDKIRPPGSVEYGEDELGGEAEQRAASPVLLLPPSVHFARNAQVRVPTTVAAVPSLKVDIMPLWTPFLAESSHYIPDYSRGPSVQYFGFFLR